MESHTPENPIYKVTLSSFGNQGLVIHSIWPPECKLFRYLLLRPLLKTACQDRTVELSAGSQDGTTATEMPAEAFAICNQSISVRCKLKIQWECPYLSVSFILFLSLSVSLLLSLVENSYGVVCV